MVAVLLQYISVSSQHAVHLKLTQYVNYICRKLGDTLAAPQGCIIKGAEVGARDQLGSYCRTPGKRGKGENCPISGGYTLTEPH